MKISEEARRAYQSTRRLAAQDYRTDSITLADFARDTLARAMMAEFKLAHVVEPRAGSEFCFGCNRLFHNSTLELDPRHRWTDEQWQQAAEAELKGAGMSKKEFTEYQKQAFVSESHLQTSLNPYNKQRKAEPEEVDMVECDQCHELVPPAAIGCIRCGNKNLKVGVEASDER
jgi:ribosomal protein L40E